MEKNKIKKIEDDLKRVDDFMDVLEKLKDPIVRHVASQMFGIPMFYLEFLVFYGANYSSKTIH